MSWEKCPGKIGLLRRNVLGELSFLGEISWEKYPGRNILGESKLGFQEKCPRRIELLGEMF
jgi:hypothetical protein